MKKIDDFRFEYRWLSNFEVADIEYEGIVYPSTEHAYQAAKVMDIEERKRIAALPYPKDAKREGKYLKLRSNWDSIKIQVMYDVCKYKFTKHAYLREKLLATEDAILIEGNWWNDTFWGVCNGKGQNKLGEILMAIREELRGENERLNLEF